MSSNRIILFIVLLLITPASICKTIYVDDNASGANDGSSWENAYIYLQDALTDASDSNVPVEIRIAQGTYKPDQGASQTSGDRYATFNLINNVTLKGGYAGFSEIDPNEQDVSKYETVLSGDLDGNDIPVAEILDMLYEPSRAENSYHVVSSSYCDESTILEGLIITGGNANNETVQHKDSEGGGFYNYRSDLTIMNCVFISNSARWNGGGMVNISSSPEITDSTFESNLVGTSSGGHGGGLYNSPGSDSLLINCIFNCNRAGEGGGIFAICCSPKVNNCHFTQNSANFGAGLEYKDSENPEIISCYFEHNSAARGAGTSFINCNPIIKESLFTYNSASNYGAAIAFLNMSSSMLVNCTLAANTSPQGGAIGCDHALYGPSEVYITNSILWNEGEEIWNNDNSKISIEYSYVEEAFRGKCNISSVDPLFVDPENNDFHLKSNAGRWDPNSESWIFDDVNSPCIDTGNPNNPVAFEQFPNGMYINMGAYGGTDEASKSPSGIHAKYGGGSGEPNDPYLVYTPEHANTIGLYEDDWDKHFKLMANIDMSEYNENEFNIIGSAYDNAFTGVFNGNGYNIVNFKYLDSSRSILGLFGCIKNPSEINNVHLVDANVVGENYVGLLVGYNNGGTIINCSSTGNIQAGQYTGGLIGINTNNAKTMFCNAITNVTGTHTTSGLVGANSKSDILYCSASGQVSGISTTGGITGRQDNGSTIFNSFSSCIVSGTSYSIGGLVGRNNYCLVSGCYSCGEVSGNNDVGGLVGFSDSEIINSYSNANVTGVENVGGLLGYNVYGLISYSYSTSKVFGDTNTGAFVGYNEGTCIYTSCFLDADIQPLLPAISNITEPNVNSATTQQMKESETFITSGWDFIGETDNGAEDIWWIDENYDYPCLWWQLNP